MLGEAPLKLWTDGRSKRSPSEHLKLPPISAGGDHVTDSLSPYWEGQGQTGSAPPSTWLDSLSRS